MSGSKFGRCKKAGVKVVARGLFFANGYEQFEEGDRFVQARADMEALVAEVLPLFPALEEREAVQRRIKAGLDRLYEELWPE